MQQINSYIQKRSILKLFFFFLMKFVLFSHKTFFPEMNISSSHSGVLFFF